MESEDSDLEDQILGEIYYRSTSISSTVIRKGNLKGESSDDVDSRYAALSMDSKLSSTAPFLALDEKEDNASSESEQSELAVVNVVGLNDWRKRKYDDDALVHYTVTLDSEASIKRTTEAPISATTSESGDAINASPNLERYFVDEVTRLSNAPTCFNCQKPGHLSRDCPEVDSRLCPYCAEAGHRPQACPLAISCHRCGEFGHKSMGCRNKFRAVSEPNETCRRCHQFGHCSSDCSSNWRQYVLESSASRKQFEYWLDRTTHVSCFVCGARKHFGGDCPELRYSSPDCLTVFPVGSRPVIPFQNLQQELIFLWSRDTYVARDLYNKSHDVGDFNYLPYSTGNNDSRFSLSKSR